MTDVILIHTSGGLIGDSLLADLREDKVSGDAKFLADTAGFTSVDGEAPTRTQHETDVEAAFRTGVALWASFADELNEGMDVGRLRDRLLRPLLEMLGFDLQYQRAHIHAGGDSFAISHLGWDGDNAPPVHLVSGGLDDRVGGKRSPHEELQKYLNAAPEKWGVVTNGTALRLLRDFHHTTTQGFVEFELASIFEAGSFADFLALYRCCHASRFRPAYQDAPEPSAADESDDEEDSDDSDAVLDDEPKPLLETLYERSLSAGVAAGKRLQPQVRHAVEALANGLLDSNADVRRRIRDEATFGRELYREVLTVLYRTLFLLYAEQREMLRGANDLYDETYSITRLRQVAEEGGVEGRRGDLWEGLKATFAAFYHEDKAAVLGVYPYNGQLFDPSRTPTVNTSTCPNHRVTEAVRALTTIQVGKVPVHVDYRNLGVEELGTVYESLLDYTLRIADEPTASDDRKVLPGQAYLAPLSIERADLASYYTPPKLVDLTLSRSLDPLITERLEAAGTDAKARLDALLDLRVIDPACGSGAFLVGALDRIALALARERTAPGEPRDTEVAAARRDVLQHCIYGADKDPFAVELAKVALWIHCVVPDQPLSFLDHHIVCGDSLVGWPMFDLPKEIPTEAFEFQKASGEDKKVLVAARDENKEYVSGVLTIWDETPDPEPNLRLPPLLAGEERTFADVRAKSQAYQQYLASEAYQQKKAAADLWTAAFFWSAASGPAPTSRHYHRALKGETTDGLIDEVEEVVAALNPLHWALAFPDVRDRGGFDLVVGNPPWEQFKGEEQEFFAEAAPDIAAMTSEHRTAAIARLADDRPELFDRWVKYRAVQDRLAYYSKVSGRYTRTSSEANTYVLFTEFAAQLIGNRGRVGLVVKSGIAADEAQTPVWWSLLDSGKVREVHDIVNSGPGGARVFPAVAAVERFCVIVLDPPSDDTAFHASTLNFGVEAAAERELRRWDATSLAKVNPKTRTLPSCATDDDLDLLLAIHGRVPTLDFYDDDASNPWGISYHTLFHSSGAKKDGLLLRREVLEDDGWELDPSKVMRGPNGEVALPVYEGQMANRWDHRARTFEGFAGKNKYGRKPHLPWVTSEQHENPAFEVEPRYWMRKAEVDTRLTETAGDKALIAFRDVGAVWTNRRSMKASLFPRYPATHTLPMLAAPRDRALAFLALLNSATFDFVVRSHLPGGHVTPWVVSQCAAPTPSQMPDQVAELARRLSVTSRALSDAYGMALHQWDDDERPVLDARSDALVARCYGLTRDEYEMVLDHFALLARMETKEVGEYRTKRLCLEAFDKLEAGG